MLEMEPDNLIYAGRCRISIFTSQLIEAAPYKTWDRPMEYMYRVFYSRLYSALCALLTCSWRKKNKLRNIARMGYLVRLAVGVHTRSNERQTWNLYVYILFPLAFFLVPKNYFIPKQKIPVSLRSLQRCTPRNCLILYIDIICIWHATISSKQGSNGDNEKAKSRNPWKNYWIIPMSTGEGEDDGWWYDVGGGEEWF